MGSIAIVSRVFRKHSNHTTHKNNRTSGYLSTKKFVAFIGIAWLVIILLSLLVGPIIKNDYFIDYIIRYDEHVAFEEVAPLPCEVEQWNLKNTSSFPYRDLFRGYADKKMTGSEGLSDPELRVLSAFVYEDYIVVTHTAQDPLGVGRKAYCHYYDCNRQKIPGSVFESFVFPMTAVHCARRAGTKYMSLTFGEEDEPQDPIPLISRINKKPPHEVGVCVGHIYGSEKRWLEIIEHVEHHKLMGATMFYFTILEMDEYSRRTIEDYERLGEAEVTNVHSEYSKANWLFHMIQTHECFFRSKFHSKWVIHVDIDERLVMKTMPVVSYFRQQPPEVCEINFGGRRVQKLKDDPAEYKSESQVLSEMLFLRHNITTLHHWSAFKSAFRPDKVHMIFFHWTWRQHDGCVVKTADRRTAYVRHFRTTDVTDLAGDWIPKYGPYTLTKLDPDFSEKLKARVLKKVKFLYDQHPVWCSSVYPSYRQLLIDDKHCVIDGSQS